MLMSWIAHVLQATATTASLGLALRRHYRYLKAPLVNSLLSLKISTNKSPGLLFLFSCRSEDFEALAD
ncbi:hypothetical protein ACTXT7_014670 [Hymenolepis weldensis]